MTQLGIYFAAAVRGGARFDELARRIEFLESIGTVLTRHMGSATTADLGHRDDRAIFADDQRLLDECHVVIADLASPSTGTGFMVARAVARHKPVLCLYPAGQAPSAMIAGCPEITTAFYADEAGFARCVRAFVLAHAGEFAALAFPAPRIILSGPPGSGKGTLGARLAIETGAPHVSTGELLRELVAHRSHGPDAHPHAAAITACMQAGELVPAAIMQDIVVERLRRPDCRLFGFILDGYPPSRADLANLEAHALVPDLVVFLDCGDATATARQVSRGARSTDRPDKARDRLAVFHQADAGFATLATRWFPNTIVARLDAEQPADAVLASVREIVANLFGSPHRDGSFSPLPAYRADTVRSTRMHLHVDARNVEVLREIAREIYARDKGAQGQLKLYPIEALHLGPQIGALLVYRQMPNFHEIEHSETEAFITGRLGDGDPALVNHAIAATRRHGGMVEVEEYVGEWTLGIDGTVVVDASYEPLAIDMQAFSEHAAELCEDIPRLELHLGFDVPKDGRGEPPLALRDLMDACTGGGLVNGGWFLFKNPRHWAYRSNEFSSEDLDAARTRLFAQAATLRDILATHQLACPVSFSLEKVHGIWIF